MNRAERPAKRRAGVAGAKQTISINENHGLVLCSFEGLAQEPHEHGSCIDLDESERVQLAKGVIVACVQQFTQRSSKPFHPDAQECIFIEGMYRIRVPTCPLLHAKISNQAEK